MKYFSNSELNSIKNWFMLFENEQELVSILMGLNFNTYIVCKGYIYLESFQKYYKKNGCLTHKQIQQLKRLSKNVYWLYMYQNHKNYGTNGEYMALK